MDNIYSSFSNRTPPLPDPVSNSKLQSLQFSPEDLLNLLNRFGKRFGTWRSFA